LPRHSRPSIVEGGYEGLDFIHGPVGAAADRLTMFRVDIATGAVLVDRLGEVMGPVFAAYGRGAAFGGGRPASGERREVRP
jgi:hypothetical protein